MRTPISRILVGGTICLVAAFFGTQLLVRLSRPQTDAEWREEQRARWRAESIAKMRQDMKDAIAAARDPKERKLYEYEFRMFEHAEKTGEIVSLVHLADGVDDFEALLLAKAYFSWEFGACGFVNLPEKDDGIWRVSIAAGRETKPQPPILIDAVSGTIRCVDHPTIADPLAFVRGPKPPNK